MIENGAKDGREKSVVGQLGHTEKEGEKRELLYSNCETVVIYIRVPCLTGLFCVVGPAERASEQGKGGMAKE